MTDENNESVQGVSTVTDEEIITAIREIGPRASVQELSDRFGYTGSAMRDRVRQLREDGRVVLDYENYNAKLYTVPDDPDLEDVIEAVESGEIEVSELVTVFDDITRLLNVCRNSLDDGEKQELAEELGMSALIARSPSSFFRDLRGRVEGRRGRMGTNSRSVDSASVR